MSRAHFLQPARASLVGEWIEFIRQEESAAAPGAASGALKVKVDGQGEVLHTLGPWRGEAVASIPLLAGRALSPQT